ncbi:MAG: hypothetical protein MRY83_15885 [Flavobacteriales bacterium]|nr:hypothetical protein [Flavobacteriales bacterium]
MEIIINNNLYPMSEIKQNQYFLKSILFVQFIGVLIYTIITLQKEGFVVFERAFEFIQTVKWIGQFTLDFQCYLMLSALWIAWRNKFSINSILFAITAMILGIIVFAPYLLYLISKEKGNLKRVLIGSR